MCAHIACTRVAHTRRAPMPTNMTCSTAGSMHRLPRSPFRDASAGPGCGSPSTAPATTEASVVNITAATCNATRSAFCPTCPTVATYTYLGRALPLSTRCRWWPPRSRALTCRNASRASPLPSALTGGWPRLRCSNQAQLNPRARSTLQILEYPDRFCV